MKQGLGYSKTSLNKKNDKKNDNNKRLREDEKDELSRALELKIKKKSKHDNNNSNKKNDDNNIKDDDDDGDDDDGIHGIIENDIQKIKNVKEKHNNNDKNNEKKNNDNINKKPNNIINNNNNNNNNNEKTMDMKRKKKKTRSKQKNIRKDNRAEAEKPNYRPLTDNTKNFLKNAGSPPLKKK